MANLKEIRTRIASVASTRQITSAMKMVAAAKLKKGQDTVTNLKPYALKMHEIMMNVASALGHDGKNIFSEERNHRQVLIVLITSNRGLCGAFNSNAIKEALLLAENKYSAILPHDKIRFMAIGKKGFEALRKRKLPLADSNTAILDNIPDYEKVAEIAESLMDSFKCGTYDYIDIVYNEFINAATQKVICKQFLPLVPDDEIDDNKKQKNIDYIFEPDKEYLIDELIPHNLKLILYQSLLDSYAAEFGARMTSMHQATDNATTLIQELTLQYNKARQAAITNEILEIVGGAEALKG